MSARLRACGGLLLIEAAMVILFMMVVAVSLAPAVTDALDDARAVRARHDLATINASVARLVFDVWPERLRPGGFLQYTLLVGPGRAPARTAAQAAGWDTPTASAGVGLLNEQLLENSGAYPQQASRPSTWRGPYLDNPVGTDPWGMRYAVNIGALLQPGIDLIAVSAGPDGEVEVPFARDGGLPSGDDLVLVVLPTAKSY